MPNQVIHYDVMFSVCHVSTIGDSVRFISIPASKVPKDHQETG